MRRWFEVIRPNTRARSAEVVKDYSTWEWPEDILVEPPMRLMLSLPSREQTIAVPDGCGPKPAAITELHLPQKAIYCGFTHNNLKRVLMYPDMHTLRQRLRQDAHELVGMLDQGLEWTELAAHIKTMQEVVFLIRGKAEATTAQETPESAPPFPTQAKRSTASRKKRSA